MKNENQTQNRRSFIQKATTLTLGVVGASSILPVSCVLAEPAPGYQGMYMIGPMDGYSPQIGALVSMLNYNRQTVIKQVEKLTMEDLDYLHDEDSNTIGALIMHLGATDKFYQANTFEGREEFNEEEEKVWGAAMKLGERGRNEIKGKEVDHYLNMINEVRAKTLELLKTKDDEWLLAIDPKWSDEDENLNTYWKWFHVCEHEANHRGQMTWQKKRLPSAKKD